MTDFAALTAEMQELRERLDKAEHRADRAQDWIDVQNLQRSYGYYVDKFQWDQVADLFARECTLEINARGKFFGQDRVREYMHHFGPPKHGMLMNHMQLQPVIHVADDGLKAKGRFRALMMVGQLGVEAKWGEAIYENHYVKQDGTWKISSLRAWQVFYTSYDKGWGEEALPLATQFGDFPPDEVTEPYPIFPDHFVPPFHYANPVTGRE